MKETAGNTRPFGIRDKVGYMFGDFGNDFTFILSTALLMKFYTDVMGVSPMLVGTMMMLARFVDAFTDVTMGQIVDRSKPTKDGKFKPWIRRMCGPVAVASFLMYATWFKDMPMGFKIFWMFFTYLLWGSVFYTSINIPYGSMASAISPDAKDRAELSNFRTIGATLAGTVIGVVMPLIVYYTNENGEQVLDPNRVAIFSLICSIGAVICYLLCFNLTTERVKVEQKTEKFDLVALLKRLFTNRALIGIVVASICMLLVQLTSQGMMAYIYPNYFRNVEAQSMAGLVGTVITLVCSVFVVRLSAKFGRRELGIFGSFFGAAVFLVTFLMHTHSAWAFLAMYSLSYVGLAFFQLTCWAMITDVIDDTEVRTGVRSDGEIYSIYSFARKLGQAASSGLTGVLLSMIGYTAATQFDPSVTNGIYNITCLVPAIGYVLLGIVLIFLYPLNRKRVEDNVAELERRRQGKK